MAAFDLSSATPLGRGTYGVVYGVDAHTAVKKIHVELNDKLRQETMKEIMFMLEFKMWENFFLMCNTVLQSIYVTSAL